MILLFWTFTDLYVSCIFFILQAFCPVTCEEGCGVKDSEKRKRAMADLEELLEKKMQFVRDNSAYQNVAEETD